MYRNNALSILLTRFSLLIARNRPTSVCSNCVMVIKLAFDIDHVSHKMMTFLPLIILTIFLPPLPSECDPHVHALIHSRNLIHLWSLTCGHVPVGSTWMYLGTDKGNVHFVNVQRFVTSGYVINWNKAIDLWVFFIALLCYMYERTSMYMYAYILV